eukprot:COSAG01_NODE_2156_length_8253_cov_15.131280_2_plen_768_part_00
MEQSPHRASTEAGTCGASSGHDEDEGEDEDEFPRKEEQTWGSSPSSSASSPAASVTLGAEEDEERRLIATSQQRQARQRARLESRAATAASTSARSENAQSRLATQRRRRQRRGPPSPSAAANGEEDRRRDTSPPQKPSAQMTKREPTSMKEIKRLDREKAKAKQQAAQAEQARLQEKADAKAAKGPGLWGKLRGQKSEDEVGQALVGLFVDADDAELSHNEIEVAFTEAGPLGLKIGPSSTGAAEIREVVPGTQSRFHSLLAVGMQVVAVAGVDVSTSCEGQDIGELLREHTERPLSVRFRRSEPSSSAAGDQSAAAYKSAEEGADSSPRDDDEAEANDGDTLPPGWEPAVSRTTGETYYINTETGKSTFERPTAKRTAAQEEVVQSLEPPKSPTSPDDSVEAEGSEGVSPVTTDPRAVEKLRKQRLKQEAKAEKMRAKLQAKAAKVEAKAAAKAQKLQAKQQHNKEDTTAKAQPVSMLQEALSADEVDVTIGAAECETSTRSPGGSRRGYTRPRLTSCCARSPASRRKTSSPEKGDDTSRSEQADADADLPAGWERALSRSDGALYYVNTVTGASQFELPTEDSLPLGWEAAVSTSTGETYYVNTETGDSTYDRPTTAAASSDATIDNTLSSMQGDGEYMETEDTLPLGWEAAVSTSTGETYYVNTETGDSTYDRPTTAAASSDATVDGLPSGWEVAVSRSTGETYYTNTESGESTFERPSNSATTNEEASDKLPPDWTMIQSSSGDYYYHNEQTGDTTWEKPME